MAFRKNRNSASPDANQASGRSRRATRRAARAARSYRAIPGGKLAEDEQPAESEAPEERASVPEANAGDAAADATPDARATLPVGGARAARKAERAAAAAAEVSAASKLTSKRVGDITRKDRAKRIQRTYRRHLVRLGIVVGVVAALALGGVGVYHSSLFTISSIAVKGVEHLTATDMQHLAAVPAGTTLLQVDTKSVADSIKRDAWVEDVQVNRVFPDTLEVVVTERAIAAVVEVPVSTSNDAQEWALSSDGMWLMPIPAQDSEAGQRTSPKVYEDAANVLRISDVPYSTKPEVGAYCTDASIKNALAIVSGMTTELSGRVTAVKASDTESTTLTIKDGPDIVFGTADNIREKERVCLQIMEEHPDGVSYINVRSPERPTWRAL